MIGSVEVGEVQRAFGYAGAGALALKALDVLIKWRSGQRTDALAELDLARKISAESLVFLRGELEATRIDLARCESHLEKAEKELAIVKKQLAITDASLAEAAAEVRALRHVCDKCRAGLCEDCRRQP